MRHPTLTSAFVALLLSPLASAQDPSAGPNHPEIESHDELVDLLQQRRLSLQEVRRRGLSMFTTPFNSLDGLGDGPFDPAESDPRSFGQRPTLQGNGRFLRLNGLDAQSCNECHTIVSAATRPPSLGIGGVGGVVQNALILPSLIDVADSADDRVSFQPGSELPLEVDGVADYDGRLANPPFLFGGGAIELLGREFTAELQALLVQARAAVPGTVTALTTSHGVEFGSLLTVAPGEVDVSGVVGLGPEDPTSVTPEELLVVTPFGRKGENHTMRDFDRGALQFHFGIEPVEVVGADVDRDGDGITNEATIGELTALHVFDVTNPPPVRERLRGAALAGQAHFTDLGCASCHVPELVTRSRFLPLAFPDERTQPFANTYFEIDLVELGFELVRHADGSEGVVVPLHADLKRHDMGPGLAETFSAGEISNSDFTTARLWGIADTAPYLHDGRATTLHEAISAHGGEAAGVRDAYLALGLAEQRKLIAYLETLRTPEDPNAELVKRRSLDLDRNSRR